MARGREFGVAFAAYRLRTLLAALQTQLELALQETDPARRHHVLDQLRSATRRTAHLANQLLSLARAEPAANHPANFRPVDLQELAQEGADLYVTRAMAAGLDLGFELEAAAVQGDGVLLRELLANLLDNAVRFTPRPGRVTVRAHIDPDRARVLEVENTGATIPEHEREKVFERFYRLDASAGEGCGLGLAVVKEIANLHGATVTLSAPSSGGGTLATARFPTTD